MMSESLSPMRPVMGGDSQVKTATKKYAIQRLARDVEGEREGGRKGRGGREGGREGYKISTLSKGSLKYLRINYIKSVGQQDY